jgi:radical SAM-linked protein
LQRIRVKYKKDLPFIGHLDMVRLWERALRRTELPAAYSEGFNPRQKLSFGPPLPLGFTSDCEYLDIYLDRWTNPLVVKDLLNKVLPPGIQIKETANVFLAKASLTAEIRTAAYTTKAAGDLSGRIKEILGSKEIVVKRKDKELNIRPMIREIAQNGDVLALAIQCDNLGSMKAQELRDLFGNAADPSFKRIALY